MEVIFREKSDIDCDSTGNITHLSNNPVSWQELDIRMPENRKIEVS
jgi:hypothetical protein